jgi:hypothetical protein
MKDYLNGHNFVLLITEPNGDDSAVLRLTGGEDVTFFKLPHIDVCDEFRELKKLQLAMRDADLFEQNVSCIAMDISEWSGNQADEFFAVTLKYLCDHRYKWRYIFTAERQKKVRVLDALYTEISRYMDGVKMSAAALLETGADSGKHISAMGGKEYVLEL